MLVDLNRDLTTKSSFMWLLVNWELIKNKLTHWKSSDVAIHYFLRQAFKTSNLKYLSVWVVLNTLIWKLTKKRG